MALTDLLVHVDDAETRAARLETAAALAAKHGAHLTGLYVPARPYLPGYVIDEMQETILRVQAGRQEDLVAAARSAFEAAASKAGVAAEWRVAEGYGAEVVSLHARYADLTVVGQIDPDVETPTGFADIPEYVALGAGRPVLVVPYAGAYPSVGKRVLVAWNAKREAVRAMNDALPILEKAKKVTVLSIDPGPDGAEAANAAALQLARHGVKAETDIVRTKGAGAEGTTDLARHPPDTTASHLYADMAIGDMLLSRTADFGADLIVMGVYGRSRLRELVMGGASRHILRQMTAPVFMSH